MERALNLTILLWALGVWDMGMLQNRATSPPLAAFPTGPTHSVGPTGVLVEHR